MTYPEHEKLQKVAPQTQIIGEFLEWVMATYAVELGRPEGPHCEFRPVAVSVQDLLAEWAGIDRDRLEQEKRQMLAEMRGSIPPAAWLQHPGV